MAQLDRACDVVLCTVFLSLLPGWTLRLASFGGPDQAIGEYVVFLLSCARFCGRGSAVAASAQRARGLAERLVLVGDGAGSSGRRVLCGIIVPGNRKAPITSSPCVVQSFSDGRDH